VIWPPTFEERLPAWHDLRQVAQSLAIETALASINDWWWRAPMVNQSLRWRDIDTWPDPWQLLNFSGFCDLARALGMLYTVMMIERDDVQTLELVQTPSINLVHVNHGKYIMNLSPGQIVNTGSPALPVVRSVASTMFERQIG